MALTLVVKTPLFLIGFMAYENLPGLSEFPRIGNSVAILTQVPQIKPESFFFFFFFFSLCNIQNYL